jgi:hypothetical protein
MVEFEDARITLAAIAASGRDKRGDDVTDVSLLALGPPGPSRALEIKAPPSHPRRGSAPVAVRAHDAAAIELEPQSRSTDAAPDERGDLRAFRPHVVELEDDRVRLTAVFARVALEMLEHQLLSLLDPLRLEGVVAAAVSRPCPRRSTA